MRILLIGFFALCAWSALATYLYVCKIKGLCDEPATMQMASASNSYVKSADTLSKPVVQEQTVIPEDLVIYFGFDKSYFNSNSEADKYFVESDKYLNQNSKTKLSITGHTDAIGTDGYNQALGFRQKVCNIFLKVRAYLLIRSLLNQKEKKNL